MDKLKDTAKVAEFIDEVIAFAELAHKVLQAGYEDEIWDNGPNFNVTDASNALSKAQEIKSRAHALKQTIK